MASQPSEIPPRSSPKTAAGAGQAGPASAAPPEEHPPDPRRPRSKSLADILLEKAMITRGQLEKALQVQQRGGGGLGRILIKMDAISEEELAQVLALSWDLPCVSLKALKVDPDIVKTVPQHICYRHKVFAVERIRTRLRLAIADPANVEALDDVRLVTGLDVDPVVATEEDILAAIAQYYGAQMAVDDSVRQAVGQAVDSVKGRAEPPAEEQTEEASVEKLQLMVEDPPIVRLVNQIIEQAIADGASDIHVEPQHQSLQVRYRIDGMLHDVMALPLVVARAVVSRIKIIAAVDIAERRIPQDGRTHLVIAGKEYDLRISTLPTVFGEGAVMRILDQSQARVGLGHLGLRRDDAPGVGGSRQQALRDDPGQRTDRKWEVDDPVRDAQ